MRRPSPVLSAGPVTRYFTAIYRQQGTHRQPGTSFAPCGPEQPLHEEDISAREEGESAAAFDSIFAQRRPQASTDFAEEDIAAAGKKSKEDAAINSTRETAALAVGR